MPGLIGTVMVAGVVSLWRILVLGNRVVGVTDTSIMHGIDERSGSAEKHYI